MQDNLQVVENNKYFAGEYESKVWNTISFAVNNLWKKK
jgi:hypothetical protein